MDPRYLQEVVPVQVTGTPDELKIENSIHPETEPKKKSSNDEGEAYISTEEIETERQGDHPEDIVRRIRNRLDEELRKDNEFRSSYMMQALNYLDHFWVILHFGSDEGVEMSAIYHSIISTLKLCGKSVWNFFGDYFRCEVL